MDIKTKAEELVAKIKNDPELLEQFQSKPVPTVEKLIGIDLPDDKITQIVDLIKAKINIDKAGDLLGKLGGLFGKK